MAEEKPKESQPQEKSAKKVPPPSPEPERTIKFNLDGQDTDECGDQDTGKSSG